MADEGRNSLGEFLAWLGNDGAAIDHVAKVVDEGRNSLGEILRLPVELQR